MGCACDRSAFRLCSTPKIHTALAPGDRSLVTLSSLPVFALILLLFPNAALGAETGAPGSANWVETLVQPSELWMIVLAEKGVVLLALTAILVSALGPSLIRATRDVKPAVSLPEKIDTLSARLHDRVTGLPNQKLLLQKLEQAAKEKENAEVALLHINLGALQRIAEEAGQRTANRVLVQITRVISNRCRARDIIARVGPDAIVVWPIKTPGTQELQGLAHRLATTLNNPIYVDRTQYCVSARIGIARQPAWNAWKALIGANLASHQAKQSGQRYKLALTLPDEPSPSPRPLDCGDLVRALERGEIVPHYQPRHDALTRTMTGIEVLARWQHPEHGLLEPRQFLNLALSPKILDRLEQTIFEKASSDCRQWLPHQHDVPELSFNLGGIKSHHPGWLSKARDLPIRFAFELSDTVLFERKIDDTLASVAKLRALGAKIILDGFGGAPCSVSNLLNIKPDQVKLDAKLVRQIVHSNKSRQRVASLIEIGSSFCPHVGAVGVETREHAEILSQAGCREVQGYFIAKPMPASDMAAVFANRARKDVNPIPYPLS